MVGLTTKGDSLAREFSKLMSKDKGHINKTAALSEGEESGPDTLLSITPSKYAGSQLEESLDKALSIASESPAQEEFTAKDMLQISRPESEEPAGQVDEMLDASIDSFSNSRVLSGLAKIASSLRSKNEAFAADMVESTAASIKLDMRKEARLNSAAVGTLKKIAKDLRAKGDSLSSDVVFSTISKITNN
tara:strand:- start:1488 stop:2057 length:570 start_codon:yes stop_codon:yes gene_type:complete